MEIYYEKRAEKYLHKLTDDIQIRLEDAINAIPDGDIKLLKGYTNLYRLRVGNNRIIFRRDDENNIYILLIGPRGDIYKK